MGAGDGVAKLKVLLVTVQVRVRHVDDHPVLEALALLAPVIGGEVVDPTERAGEDELRA
jgi:hypothetical protein